MNFKEYTGKFGIKLNTQQQEAVKRVDGNTLLLAVPGSGKTTVIVSRLGYMFYCLDIPKNTVLTLTYNVSACRDMRQRYISYFGEEKLPQFRTIHGICAVIISKYAKLRGTKPFKLIHDQQGESKLLYKIYTEICGRYPEPGVISEIKRNITYIRNMMLDETRANDIFDANYDLQRIMQEYALEKKTLGLMDYDDQLEYALKILKTQPDILQLFRRRYKYINVDEAQDTSKIQHEIISLLSSGNLFMVGDEDQSIYGFRAAYPRALLDFENNYPDATVLFLEQNFRSTGKILKRASALISNNKGRRKKQMFTTSPDGEDIEIITLYGREEQYNLLCNISWKIPESNQKVAVLFRNNDSALPLISKLDAMGIPFFYREKDSPFFEHQGICDILLLLDAVYSNSKESFAKVGKRLGCALHDSEIQNICNLSDKKEIPKAILKNISPDDPRYYSICILCDAMIKAKRCTPPEAIDLLCDNTCFGKHLSHNTKNFRNKMNILSYIAHDCRNKQEFDEKIYRLRRITSEGSNVNGNGLIISTVHSSKGLEYDTVYIIDVKDGEFPMTEIDFCLDESEENMLEEERRLFYVAVTRAKKSVKIIRYTKEFDMSLCPGSIFIDELMKDDAKDFILKNPDVFLN